MESPGFDAGRDGKAGKAPLPDTVLEVPDVIAVATQEGDPAGRRHAIRSPAVGDDLGLRRQQREVLLEIVERDGHGARDVTRLVFLPGTQIEEDDVTGSGPADELVPADRLEPIGGSEVGPDDLLNLGQAVVRHGAERRKQPVYVVTGEAVEDPGSIAPGVDQPCPAEGLEMRRGERDAHVRLGRQRLDAVLALGEQVEQLDAARAREGLADPGELLVEFGLRRASAHRSSIPTIIGIR